MRTRLALVLTLLLALALPAVASDLSGAVAAIAQAMTARVTAIGNAAKGSPERTEAQQLAKGAKALAKFGGQLDAKGVRVLAKAAKSVARSGTLDVGVANGVRGLLDCAAELFAASEQQLLAQLPGIYAPSDVETLQGYLADARAASAVAADPESGLDAALLALKPAATAYTRAAAFAQKVLQRQEGQRLPILQYPYAVQNRNGVDFKIQKVAFDLVYTPQGGGAPVRIQEDFRDHEDAASGFTLPYLMVGTEAEFEMYPTLYRAVAAVLGTTPNGSVIGVIHFKSSKHGKVDIPVDDFLFAP